MISKIEVWGDSILRGVVLDPETRRYSRLKEASCVALSSRALGIPAENHARFGMTSEKGRVVMEREIPAHAEGEAALIGSAATISITTGEPSRPTRTRSICRIPRRNVFARTCARWYALRGRAGWSRCL